jgi:hypothetical protein
MLVTLARKRKTVRRGLNVGPGCVASALVTGLALIGGGQVRGQDAETSPDKRLQNATLSFSEVMHEPDKGIPRDLFDKSRCIVIIPGVKKAAFIVGGKYGRGFVSCRRNGTDHSERLLLWGLKVEATDCKLEDPRQMFSC